MFAFDRTVSRLLEMQSREYVEAAQAAFPQGPAFVDHAFSYAIRQHQKPHAHVTSAHTAEAQTAPLEKLPDDSLLQRIAVLDDGTLLQNHKNGDGDGEAGSAERAELRRDLRLAVEQLWRQYRIGSIDEVAHSTAVAGEGTPADLRSQAMRREDCAVCLSDIAEYAVRLFTRTPCTSTVEQAVKLADESLGQTAISVRNIVHERLYPASLAALSADDGAGYCSFAQFEAAVLALLYSLVRNGALLERMEGMPHWLPFKRLLDATKR